MIALKYKGRTPLSSDVFADNSFLIHQSENGDAFSFVEHDRIKLRCVSKTQRRCQSGIETIEDGKAVKEQMIHKKAA